MKHVYKFVKHEAPPLENLKDSNTYQILEKLNQGETLTREEKNSIKVTNGYVHLMGYHFSYIPYMRIYLVKLQYHGWREYYHFDKTSLRNALKNAYVTPAHIFKIIDITDL